MKFRAPPIPSEQDPPPVLVDSTGSYLYVANKGSNNISALPSRRLRAS